MGDISSIVEAACDSEEMLQDIGPQIMSLISDSNQKDLKTIVDTIKKIIKNKRTDSPVKLRALKLFHQCLMKGSWNFILYSEKKIIRRLQILARFGKGSRDIERGNMIFGKGYHQQASADFLKVLLSCLRAWGNQFKVYPQQVGAQLAGKETEFSQVYLQCVKEQVFFPSDQQVQSTMASVYDNSNSGKSDSAQSMFGSNLDRSHQHSQSQLSFASDSRPPSQQQAKVDETPKDKPNQATVLRTQYKILQESGKTATAALAVYQNNLPEARDPKYAADTKKDLEEGTVAAEQCLAIMMESSLVVKDKEQKIEKMLEIQSKIQEALELVTKKAPIPEIQKPQPAAKPRGVDHSRNKPKEANIQFNTDAFKTAYLQNAQPMSSSRDINPSQFMTGVTPGGGSGRISSAALDSPMKANEFFDNMKRPEMVQPVQRVQQVEKVQSVEKVKPVEMVQPIKQVSPEQPGGLQSRMQRYDSRPQLGVKKDMESSVPNISKAQDFQDDEVEEPESPSPKGEKKQFEFDFSQAPKADEPNAFPPIDPPAAGGSMFSNFFSNAIKVVTGAESPEKPGSRHVQPSDDHSVDSGNSSNKFASPPAHIVASPTDFQLVQTQLDNAEFKITKLEKQLKQAKTDLEKERDGHKQLKGKHQTLQKEHTTTTKAIGQAVDKIREMERAEEQFKRREEEYKKIIKLNKELQDDNLVLSKGVEEYQKLVDEYNELEEELKQANEKHERETKQLKKEYEQKSKHDRDKIKQLESELQVLKRQQPQIDKDAFKTMKVEKQHSVNVLDSSRFANLNKQPSIAETDIDAMFAHVDEDSGDESVRGDKKSQKSGQPKNQKTDHSDSDGDLQYVAKPQVEWNEPAFPVAEAPAFEFPVNKPAEAPPAFEFPKQEEVAAAPASDFSFPKVELNKEFELGNKVVQAQSDFNFGEVEQAPPANNNAWSFEQPGSHEKPAAGAWDFMAPDNQAKANEEQMPPAPPMSQKQEVIEHMPLQQKSQEIFDPFAEVPVPESAIKKQKELEESQSVMNFDLSPQQIRKFELEDEAETKGKPEEPEKEEKNELPPVQIDLDDDDPFAELLREEQQKSGRKEESPQAEKKPEPQIEVPLQESPKKEESPKKQPPAYEETAQPVEEEKPKEEKQQEFKPPDFNSLSNFNSSNAPQAAQQQAQLDPQAFLRALLMRYFRQSLLQSQAVLYEDANIQLGCVTTLAVDEGSAQCRIFFKNKSTSTIKGLKFGSMLPPYGFESRTEGDVDNLQQNQSGSVNIKMSVNSFAFSIPVFSLKYMLDDKIAANNIPIRLPLMAVKFCQKPQPHVVSSGSSLIDLWGKCSPAENGIETKQYFTMDFEQCTSLTALKTLLGYGSEVFSFFDTPDQPKNVLFGVTCYRGVNQCLMRITIAADGQNCLIETRCSKEAVVDAGSLAQFVMANVLETIALKIN